MSTSVVACTRRQYEAGRGMRSIHCSLIVSFGWIIDVYVGFSASFIQQPCERQSGLRRNANVAIVVDVAEYIASGGELRWTISSNGVILCSGLHRRRAGSREGVPVELFYALLDLENGRIMTLDEARDYADQYEGREEPCVGDGREALSQTKR